MAKHIVTCRVCKMKFDTNDPNAEYEKIGTVMYYHKSCYQDWKRADTDPSVVLPCDDNWHDKAKEYLSKTLRMSVDWAKFESQWKNFLRPAQKPQMTEKGMYFALRYHFDVQHGKMEKAAGGIGIIPFVYEESCQYWVREKARYNEILAQIREQEIARQNQEKVIIKTKKKTNEKRTSRFSLDEVEDS